MDRRRIGRRISGWRSDPTQQYTPGAMGHLDRYILRQLVAGTVLVTVGLLCIVWLTQSLRFVEVIISRGMSVWTFLQFTGLMLPNLLGIILPICLFAVVLFVYNKLNSDRELVVMRAAGISPLALARPALVVAAILTVLGALLAHIWGPQSMLAFRDMQYVIRHDVSGLLLQEGAFTTIGSGVTVYVRNRDASGELIGIMVHDASNPDEIVTTMAERGALLRGREGADPQRGDTEGMRVHLVNGSRHWVDRETGSMSQLYFDSYTLTLADHDGADDIRLRKAAERRTSELLTVQEGEELYVSAREVRRFRVEAHQRIINPLSTLGFALIALATVLTGAFDRRGSGGRLIVGISAMIAAQAGMIGAASLASGTLTFVPLIYLAVIGPLVGAALLLARPLLGQYRMGREPLSTEAA